MATIAENLQILKDSTDAIKLAIIDKGGDVSGDISTWADSIANIVSGNTGGAGSVFKITNKLNGALIGGPNYNNQKNELIHTYEFEGGEIGSQVIIVNYDPINDLKFPRPETATWKIVPHVSYNEAASGIMSYAMTQYGLFTVYVDYNSNVWFYATGLSGYTSLSPCYCIYIAFDINGNCDFDFFQVQSATGCFLKDSLITLSDKTQKLIQDVNYNDELLVWNFDEGTYNKAKPLWIKKLQTNTWYYKLTFSDGNILKVTGTYPNAHRLFNYTDLKFEYANNCVGKLIYTLNGIVTLESCEYIEEVIEHYNIITHHHMNCFANGILTSCRYNNIYPIKDMKFIKDNRLNKKPRWKVYGDKFKPYPVLTVQYLEGLRLYEQLDIPVEETVKYVTRLESLKKTLSDFEENQTIYNNIDETNVGWIDPDGNVYGYKLYMPGQMNHIILANKIGKDLELQEEKLGGYSRTLEKLGWIKYTNEFLSTSNEVTSKQERKIHQFLNNNKKVKERGTIKMGSMFGDENSLDYIKMMPKKDLINKMRGR